METDWAVKNLETIRTLMERSALYRRALAPILLLAGCLGTASAVAGTVFNVYSPWAFLSLWYSTALIVLAGAFVIARRQALKEREPFWTPPTRRVAQALLPPLMAGMLLGPFLLLPFSVDLVVFLWIVLYGCALCAAGFFMPRGIRLFGWIFVLSPFAITAVDAAAAFHWSPNPHLVMGAFFGLGHLAYSAYLYLTEKRPTSP
ncbi:MAG: hypothetical protein U1F98_05390 [Verrucomicrobiota bacterium]